MVLAADGRKANDAHVDGYQDIDVIQYGTDNGRVLVFFFPSRRRHTRSYGDWSSDVCSSDLARALRETAPQIIHAHAPGHPHPGDILGQALALVPKIPVLQTNIFGRLENPSEDAWRSEERRVGKEGAAGRSGGCGADSRVGAG